jgi:pimeloyl-ACP methyl ester carboxylesterase
LCRGRRLSPVPRTQRLRESAAALRSRWRVQSPRLGAPSRAAARKAHSLTVDLRGHGASKVDDGSTCTLGQLADDVAELIGVLDLGPTVLIGHSFGSRVVLQAGFAHPDHIAGMVLIDGSRMWR